MKTPTSYAQPALPAHPAAVPTLDLLLRQRQLTPYLESAEIYSLGATCRRLSPHAARYSVTPEQGALNVCKRLDIKSLAVPTHTKQLLEGLTSWAEYSTQPRVDMLEMTRDCHRMLDFAESVEPGHVLARSAVPAERRLEVLNLLFATVRPLDAEIPQLFTSDWRNIVRLQEVAKLAVVDLGTMTGTTAHITTGTVFAHQASVPCFIKAGVALKAGGIFGVGKMLAWSMGGVVSSAVVGAFAIRGAYLSYNRFSDEERHTRYLQTICTIDYLDAQVLRQFARLQLAELTHHA